MRKMTMIIMAGIVVGLFALALAHPTLEGYSGAPGSNGICASSCHGGAGGTIRVDGFPTEYEPGRSYIIAVSHDGGNPIKQFNASCRIGEGSENAGVISEGLNTEIYNNFKETNGVHFDAVDQDTGTFVWTAPAPGAGEARLYLAGLQGAFGGLNSALTLTATEMPSGSICGDPNCDGSVNIGDAVYLINYIFKFGPAPCSECP